jgi:hypothetical protein
VVGWLAEKPGQRVDARTKRGGTCSGTATTLECQCGTGALQQPLGGFSMSRTNRTKASRRAKRREKQPLRQTRKASQVRESNTFSRIFDVLQIVAALITILAFLMAAMGN